MNIGYQIPKRNYQGHLPVIRASLWTHIIASPGTYQKKKHKPLAETNLEDIMEAESGAASPVESEAMELGYEPYSNS